MSLLWQGIVANSVASAMPAFFPEDAYVRLKDVADPADDYLDRLVHDYRLDLGAAHALLGADATSSQLVGVTVPSEYAHWVPPGTCYNRVGYFEVPNSRLVYRRAGHTWSLGIASMISWRGTWYVVHLGAILRQADEGTVDDPEPGRGNAIPSSSC
jgi:hypothetical protein